MSAVPDPDAAAPLHGRPWRGIQAVIERRKAERFAEQTWRPGCAHCGESCMVELGPDDAAAWWRTHRCAVRRAAA